MEHCNQIEKINKLDEAINGNGQPGLKSNVAVLNENIKLLKESNEKVATAISGINKFMAETEGKRKANKFIVPIAIFLTGTIVTLITKIF